MIRVLVAEDMNVIRTALVTMLSLEPDIDVVAQLEHGEEVLPAILRHNVDVAVLDIELKGIDGLSVAQQIERHASKTAVLMLTAYGTPSKVRQALAVSVRAFLTKDCEADTLLDAIRKVANQEWVLSPELIAAAFKQADNPLNENQAHVLRAIAAGATISEAARQLRLAPGTVRNYVSQSLAKLKARNRIDAIRIAKENSWI